jgi:hypothetical protein
MFTFSRTGNVVKLEVDTDIVYLSPASFLHARDGKVFITNENHNLTPYSNTNTFILSPLAVNGRPSDDAGDVTEWLTTNYFYGFDYSGGGGSWPADYSTSVLQASQLSKLTDVETKLNDFKNKTASHLVDVKFDEKEIVYTGDDIDYISYKLAASEVARITFSYDVNGNITGMIRS